MMTSIRADIFTVCSVRLSGSLRNEIGVTLSLHDQKTLDTPIKQETRRSKLLLYYEESTFHFKLYHN